MRQRAQETISEIELYLDKLGRLPTKIYVTQYQYDRLDTAADEWGNAVIRTNQRLEYKGIPIVSLSQAEV